MFRDSSDSALTAGWATTRKSGCGEDGESVEDLLVKTLLLVVEVLALPVMTVYNEDIDLLRTGSVDTGSDQRVERLNGVSSSSSSTLRELVQGGTVH